MTLGLLLAIPAVALAAELVTSELDTTTPNAVTVTQGGSTSFNIGLQATGSISNLITETNASIATVDTAYSLDGAGIFTKNTPSSGSKFFSSADNPTGNNSTVTWTGAPTPYSVAATISAAATTPTGAYTLTLSPTAGDTSVSNPSVSGGKLEDGTASTITVHVVAPPPPSCTTPNAPVFTTKGTDFDGSNGWFKTNPTILATSTSSSATITYATELNGGTKSAYSDTAPTLAQGTTKVYAKATSGTCTSETIDTFKVDTIAPTVNPASVVNNVWRNSSLSETFAASDGGSGLANSADASFTLTASAESADASTPTVDSREVFDVAGNSTTRSVSAKIDLTNPVISGADITQTAWRNTALSANFTASDVLSGLANSSDASFTLTTSGDSPNATTPVTASKTVDDNAGNSASRTISAFVDTADPTIQGSASPAPNGAGWNNTDVDVTFDCDDGLSGIASCGPDQTLQDEGTGQSATGTATDNAGNSVDTTVSGINIDKTDPNVNCGIPDTNWHASDVSIACTASDALSDLADPGDASFNLSTSVDANTETSSAETNSRNVLDNADNSTTAGPISPIKVDKKDPTFGACPTAGPFTQGTGSHSVGTITANDGGSGLNTGASMLSGSVDTNTIGAKTVTFTAKDNVDNSDTKVCSYDVDYNWTGFFQPIDNKDSNGNYILNKAKAGSVVPVKFSLGSDQGLNVFASGGYPQTASIPCTASSSDALEEYGTGNVSSFKYDPVANQYIYNWKTDTKWAGTCRQLVVKLADDTYHRANFNFFK
jgi:hypothetical protein